MITGIEGIAEQHALRPGQGFAQQHARAIARRRSRGVQITISTSDVPLTAYINIGRWIVDCPCGAGCATDPVSNEARCFGCGTVHTTIIFPAGLQRLEIEAQLLDRPKTANRNWVPGESALDLAVENAAYLGLPIAEDRFDEWSRSRSRSLKEAV